MTNTYVSRDTDYVIKRPQSNIIERGWATLPKVSLNSLSFCVDTE